MSGPVDLNLIRSFTAVYETSFSRAADRLGTPRSTMSRAVVALEAALGVRLFSRTTRSVRPTVEARSLYARVTPSLGQLESALADLPQQAARPAGTLRLTSPPDLAGVVLAEVSARFVTQYPEVTIELNVATTVVDLVQEGFDFALRVAGGPLKSSGLSAQRLGRVDIQIYASPTYLTRAGAPRSVAELDRHSWVVFRGPPPLQQKARQLTLEPVAHARIVCDDMSFAREAARRHAGLVALPRFLAEPDVEAGLLTRVLPTWRARSAAVYLVRPSHHNPPARAKLFRDALVSFLKEQPLR